MKKKLIMALLIIETLFILFIGYWWLVTNSGKLPELNADEFKSYFEGVLVPEMVKYATIALTLFFAITPYLIKIKNGADKFAKTTDDVNSTVKTGKEIYANVQKLESSVQDTISGLGRTVKDTMRIMMTDFTTKTKSQEQINKDTKEAVQRIEKMLLIGFGNTEELVRKGYAAEIARVKDENKTENPTDM